MLLRLLLPSCCAGPEDQQAEICMAVELFFVPYRGRELQRFSGFRTPLADACDCMRPVASPKDHVGTHVLSRQWTRLSAALAVRMSRVCLKTAIRENSTGQMCCYLHCSGIGQVAHSPRGGVAGEVGSLGETILLERRGARFRTPERSISFVRFLV